MLKRFLFFAICLLISATVLAQSATYTLFAVDVSLSTIQKDTAFDVIRETILVAPETQYVSLTLFDDTVRGYVALARLDAQQVQALNQAMTHSSVSMRSTSNLAVGIERSIDQFTPEGTANLVVFARGVIDTVTQDPRARFTDWLDRILLPQAAQSNIAITLVIPQGQPASPEITIAFARTLPHQIIVSEHGSQAAPELISLLGIPNRIYGGMESHNKPLAESPPAPTNVVTNGNSDSAANWLLSQLSFWPAVRIALLTLASALLVGIVIWRFRARRTPRNPEHTTQTSSTYLPLTEKPGKAMDRWMNVGTDKSIGRASDAQKPTSDPQSSGHQASSKSANAGLDETDPWDTL